MSWTAEALLAGSPQPFRGDETSAIAKSPVGGKVVILRNGIAPDRQADR